MNTTTTTTMSSTPILHRAGQAPRLDVFGVVVRPLLGGEATEGACSIAHITCPPGAGAPPHRHAHGEAFYVLSGRVAVRCEEAMPVLDAGDFVAVPPGVVHAFKNVGEGEAVLINVGTPAGHELFFRDVDALVRSGGFNPDAAADVCRRHGIELVA